MTGEIRAGQPGASPPSVHKPIRNQTTSKIADSTRSIVRSMTVSENVVDLTGIEPVTS